MKKVGVWWTPDWDNNSTLEHYKSRDEWQNHFADFIVEMFFPDNWPADDTRNFKKRLAIDVGANIGQMAAGLSKHFEQVVSFEVIAKLEECYYKNTYDNCTFIPTPLSDREGTVFLTQRENTAISKITRREHQPGNSKKTARTLDSYNFKNVDLIKIDVEGWEQKVLDGAINTIVSNRPIIVVEIGNAKSTDHFVNIHKTLYDIEFVEYYKRRNDYIFVHKNKIQLLTKNILEKLNHPWRTHVPPWEKKDKYLHEDI
jgi:FkbM family methyltransferase